MQLAQTCIMSVKSLDGIYRMGHWDAWCGFVRQTHNKPTECLSLNDLLCQMLIWRHWKHRGSMHTACSCKCGVAPEEECDSSPQATTDNLINSMQRRYTALRRAHGSHIRYWVVNTWDRTRVCSVASRTKFCFILILTLWFLCYEMFSLVCFHFTVSPLN